jgi:hypothetical protein
MRRRSQLLTATTLLLCASGLCAQQLAMGPNPGGRLGEDMPFQGQDVIRHAPAATAERAPQSAEPSARQDTHACDEPKAASGCSGRSDSPGDSDASAQRQPVEREP